jgi:hypothetical protein
MGVVRLREHANVDDIDSAELHPLEDIALCQTNCGRRKRVD